MPSYVIVGASRGLGLQFLRTLSADPSNVVVGTVRTPSSAPAIKNVHIVAADLTNPASLSAAAKQTAEITGGIVDHLIINGAYLAESTAFFGPKDFIGKEDTFRTELVNSMDANVAGTLFAVNAFVPLVKESSIKKVVVISTGHADPQSVVAAKIKDAIPYALSKIAVNLLVKKLAIEYEGDRISFLALSPGFVDTRTDEEGNLDPNVKAAYEMLTKVFQALKPDFNGPITPVESIEAQLEVIHGLKFEQSGEFLSHHGNTEWL